MQNVNIVQSQDIIFFNKTEIVNNRVMAPQISFLKDTIDKYPTSDLGISFNSLIIF